jgi:raffinose/stachyose/melibiose transport system substrate-binding protein
MEREMKKTFQFLSLLIVISLLAACATPTPPPPAATEAPVVTEAPAATEAPVTTEAPVMTEAPVATEAPASAEPVKLVIWWWGEQEAPGAQKWMDETIAKFQEANPNITIEAVLQSTDTLIPAFKSAAAAKEGPDIQYFWGGVWTLEDAWAGSLVPLEDLIPQDELKHYINNFERTWDGKQWGVGWYLSGNPMVFNPDLFTQAGLDPANPPKTWDELKDACTKLNGIGVTPIAGGLKDGWFGGWLFSILARQTHDTEKDFMAASVGQYKFTDPNFAEWWSRLNELKEAGCWNKDINSLDYQQGQDMFVQGKAGMIFGNDTFLKGWADTIGWDKMDVMMVPKYGTGKLADTYIVTAQGMGITSWSKYPKEAAAFLMFMHTSDRLNAWFQDTGVFPADDRFDTNLITQPVLKKIFGWDTSVAGANLENFIPSMLDEQSNFAGVQLLFAGDKTPEELAALAEEVIAKWREQNPDALKNFEIWAK